MAKDEENYRRWIPPCCPYQSGNIEFVSSYTSLSVFYQIPQYVLMGLSQGFALVASAEFVLSRAPPGYQAITFGFLNLFTGVGVLLGCCISVIVKPLNLTYQSIPAFDSLDKNATRRYLKHELSSKAYVFHIIFIFLMILNIIFYAWVEYRHNDLHLLTATKQEQSID
eukprot:m.27504 g.27504  ORF g.27504 m.27504 type:complete len:168 (+) comp30129_c0_seq1:8-511(+)